MKHSKIVTHYFILGFSIPLLLLSKCTQNMAGATTETTNGVTGSIYNSDSTPAPNTIVSLLTYDYNPVEDTAFTKYIDTTDNKGLFSFRSVKPGKYSILARNKLTLSGTLVRNVDINADSITEPPPAHLFKTSSITADFNSQGSTTTGTYVYIPGTDIYSYIQKGEPVTLDNIPSGVISEIILSRVDGQKFNVLREDIQLQPGLTVAIENPLWKYSRQINLNTSSSGAEISSNLYNFPILLRLNKTNFDFSQAQPGGKDIVFTKKSGGPLPAEIERWDDIGGHAEVWVKIDTIYGNNSDQLITMYWGNPDASTPANNNHVFDTANGFHSVWHLDETSDTIMDASINHFKGVRNGPAKQATGIIGFGQTFSDSGAFFNLGNICNLETRGITLSIWLKRDTSGLQTLFAQSNGGKPSVNYGWSFSFDIVDNLHFYAATTTAASWGNPGSFNFWSKTETAILDTTTWHHVAVVFNRATNDSCKCYIDGVDVTATLDGNVTSVGSIINTLSLRIGSESDNNYSFTGSIDECVISNKSRGSNWIKLSYINQGSNDRLIQFR
jgi:hypothetical protein